MTARTYELAEPIFDRARRRFHPIVRLLQLRIEDDAVCLRLETRQGVGHEMDGRITFAAPDVARIQTAFGGPPSEHLTEMLVGPPPRLALHVVETDDEVRIDAGGPVLVLERDPWRVRFGEFSTEPGDTSIVEHVAEPGGWVETDNHVQVYETVRLRPNEALWGLGERFLGPQLRGRRLEHWIEEPWGTNTTDRVYKSVPLVTSSRGYGMFFHHPERATFDLGATSTSSGSVLVDATELDLFVIVGDPKHVLDRYTNLTGRPGPVPEWSFGVWMSKCMYRSRVEVEEVLARADELEVPVDVVSIDPMWLANRSGYTFDFCDFVWDEAEFGPMDQFIDWLHGRDVKVCLWINPNVAEGLDAFVPEHLVDAGRTRDPVQPQRGFVDFTGAGADWWRRELGRLVEAGVDAFKLDYGESLPADARTADGRTGAEVHNLYPLLASITAADAGIGLAYTRGGTSGSQRYPVHWSGDAQSSWAGLAGALRGALSLSWSGFAHWACDIGGFHKRDVHPPEDHPAFGFARPDPELFIRWTQFGLLCSHARFHGIQGREPWLFGDDAVAVARDFAALRRRLRGYLVECAREAERTGCPVMRPTALEFPEDRGSHNVDTQYLLGPGLLVAPVLEPDGRVDVYVPPGRWTDHFTGEIYDGPRWVHREKVPLDQLPLLVREGHQPFQA